MKKHLTFKDNKSDKFWSIEVNGKSFTVTYGKAGTAGQTSVKEFDTEGKCMKEAEKLVSEKVKKGYIESATDIAGKDNNLTQIIGETNSGIGARLMSKKLRYEMQDDDITESYLFTMAPGHELKMYYDGRGTAGGNLLFTGAAIESAVTHIDLCRGLAHSHDGYNLPDKIISELPPFLLSHNSLKELKQKGKSKFKVQWSYDRNEPIKITVQGRKEIKINIDGEDIDVPILMCAGLADDDCDDITLWVVEDDEWPIILIHDWGDEFFWKFLEAGDDLKPGDTTRLENRFDFNHYGIPPYFERQIISVFENYPEEKEDCVKNWKPILNKHQELHENFSDKLQDYAIKFHDRVREGHFEDVREQLDETILFFEELLGKGALNKEFEKLRSVQKILNETILHNELKSAFGSSDVAKIVSGVRELPEISDTKMQGDCMI